VQADVDEIDAALQGLIGQRLGLLGQVDLDIRGAVAHEKLQRDFPQGAAAVHEQGHGVEPLAVHLAEDVAAAFEGDLLFRGHAPHDDPDPELRFVLCRHSPTLAVFYWAEL